MELVAGREEVEVSSHAVELARLEGCCREHGTPLHWWELAVAQRKVIRFAWMGFKVLMLVAFTTNFDGWNGANAGLGRRCR